MDPRLLMSGMTELELIRDKFLLPFPQYPTPADWTLGRTLVSLRGPCLSVASWPALQRLASVPFDVASLGVNGFGSFPLHNKGGALRDAPSNKLVYRGETRKFK